MCDYCGCRRHPTIALLSDEHERIESLASALGSAHAEGAPTRTAQAAAELVAALAPHTDREEHGLFVELDAAGATEHADQLRTEHAQLDAVFRRVAHGDRAAWAQLDSALRALHRHILREEQDVFPAADQLLDDAAWNRVNAGPGAVGMPAGR